MELYTFVCTCVSPNPNPDTRTRIKIPKRQSTKQWDVTRTKKPTSTNYFLKQVDKYTENTEIEIGKEIEVANIKIKWKKIYVYKLVYLKYSVIKSKISSDVSCFRFKNK